MKNHLNDNFYRNPERTTTVLTKEQLRETLLNTSGWITANGEIYNIEFSLGKRVFDYAKRR